MFPTDNDFKAQVSLETEAIPVPEDSPFHILFLGDYSGRQNLTQNSEIVPPDFQTYEIDRDNFEEVMKELRISLRLELSESNKENLEIKFNDLDDFHPDNIFQKIPLFSELRDLRKKLLNSQTFEVAAREIRSWFDESSQDVVQENNVTTEPDLNSESSGNLLDDILSDTKASASSYNKVNGESKELNGFIKDIVRSHLIHTDETEQEKLISIVDESTSELMRKILHHPDFKALESAWRGLYFVVRRTDTSNDLKLFLMDVSKQEISDNLKSVENLIDSKVFHKIVTEKPSAVNPEPFALICGNYDFELNVEDAATLMRLAKIGNVLSAPFISQIKPQMLGINSFKNHSSSSDWNLSDETQASKLWTMLRTIPEAVNIGIPMPKFITRLPYSEATEPTETFSFEEFIESSEHDNYVWTNSSFIIALLLAQSFRSYGWEFKQNIINETDGLPVHIFTENGETKIKSCTEIDMTHNACDLLIEQGFMPLINFRNTDKISLADFQSISYPSKSLNSIWS